MSIIGGKSDRKETLRALQNSMGFIRHELGRNLRIKRIPALHVHLDDSAERGTRVLHLLQELEQGADPETITPFNESLPTPVKRLPHEGDAEEPDAAEATRCRGRGRPAADPAGAVVRPPAVAAPRSRRIPRRAAARPPKAPRHHPKTKHT